MSIISKTNYVFTSKSLAALLLLSRLVLLKGPYVKARDITKLLGIEDRGIITYVGRTLSLLNKAGLAKRFNNARPRRYYIMPWVAERIAAYGFRCFQDLPCPYMSSCPIREAIKGVIGRD